MKLNNINQVRAGAAVSYVTIFFNIISGFLYTPWLIKQLGQSDYAIYTLVTSVMTYFVLDFGMGAAITRFIAKYRAENEPQKINNLLGVTTKLYLFIDGIILVALVVFYSLSGNIYVNLTPDELEKFKSVFIIAGTASLLSFPLLPVNGIYTAYEKLYIQKVFDLLSKVLTVSSVIIALLFGGGLYAVVLFNTFVNFIMLLAKFIYIRRSEKFNINLSHKDKQLQKSIFSFSLWVMVASIADRFFFTFIPSLLGVVSDSSEIAKFGVAVSIENYVCLFSSVFNNLFLPRVTKMVIKKEDPEKITDLMIKVGRIQLLVVLTIVTAIVSMGKEFIRCWVGAGYEDSYIVLAIVLIPTLVHFCQGIGVEMIYATNNVKYRALVYTLGSIISIAISLILGGKYGAIGAAIGIGVALVVSHVILINIIYKVKLELNVFRYFKECQLKLIPLAVISGVIGYVIMIAYPVDSLMLFIIKAGVWGIAHIAIMWLFGANKYEKGIVLGLVKKLKNKLIK